MSSWAFIVGLNVYGGGQSITKEQTVVAPDEPKLLTKSIRSENRMNDKEKKSCPYFGAGLGLVTRAEIRAALECRGTTTRQRYPAEYL